MSDRVFRGTGIMEFFLYDGDGMLSWRRGTGDNVEVCHFRVDPDQQRRGVGQRLLRGMLEALREWPPYHSVYGFTRTGNAGAQAFYTAMGFELSPVGGVYMDGSAVVFSQAYERLCELHLEGKQE